VKPLLNSKRFAMGEVAAAHDLVKSGANGKVVVEFQESDTTAK
jgi:hypothetical protein